MLTGVTGTNTHGFTFMRMSAVIIMIVMGCFFFCATAVIINHLHTIMMVHFHHTKIDQLSSLKAGWNEKSDQQK